VIVRAEPPLNRELIADLRESRKDGELYPVIKARFPDGEEKIISGNHRTAAGWKSLKTIPVKNEFEFLKMQLAATVQRKSSFEEQAQMIRKICDYLAKEAGMQKEKIGNHVSKTIRGITKSYLYEMIPDEYKRGRSSGEAAKLKGVALLQSIPNLESSPDYAQQQHPFATGLPPSDRIGLRTDNKTPDRILKMPCCHEGCSKPLYMNVTQKEAYHKEN
jgi:hypothetical protein